ncbi:LysR family transcriptional regulator [Pusillimonas caeni]|uniref:LysR family transcriptional regulator n=1 Tax=Pusillimonas caeni TaxID=1348472 RepID=UPI000E59FA83|nr:LysR family transcriptional regulator [Pusillimonas caeni]TFL13264.1 LysR family transcriptional regulator [Pusillimonas caeni]
MHTRLLEYMLRVAELGSINKAALDLNLSQPTLSRHIAALEKLMGTALFVRTQGGVSLTEAGRLLADRARPLLRQFSMLKDQVGEMATGQLSIGVPTSWQKVFTSRFVGTLVKQHPEIKLRVHEGVSNILRDHLLAGVLDLCIIPFDPSPPTGYVQTPLVREPLIVLGNRAENLDPGEPTPISRVDGAKLILPGRPNAITSQIEHMLKRKGMHFNIAVETDTLALCLDLAREGLGLTIVPACALYEHGMSDISWSPLRGLYLTWSLFESLARSHSQAVHEGRRLVHSTVAEAVGQAAWHGVEATRQLAHAAPDVEPAG